MFGEESGEEAGEGGGEGGGRSIAELRRRIDGFTPERQRRFLKWLGKTGCVSDAAGKAGISTTTIDRTRRTFADFDARCVAALDLALPRLEAIAYRRATVGAPEKVIRKGKVVQVKQKPSDAMLRLLLTGAAPRKYGRYAGLRRAGGDKRSKRAQQAEPPIEQVRDEVVRQVQAIRRHRLTQGGYSEGPEGVLVPPGWRMVREEELERLGWSPPEGEEAAAAGGGAAEGGASGALG